MRTKIRHISHAVGRYQKGTFGEFIQWWDNQPEYEFDIETDIHEEHWLLNNLISMQFGSTRHPQVSEQWFIQWSELTDMQKQIILDRLNACRRIKYIHKGSFEYCIMRKYGVYLENIFDTLLAEKVLRGGAENVDYALADISWKYLRIIMDKTLQVAFGDNIITDEKILYGCTDVMYLHIIKKQQIEEAAANNLSAVLALEMAALPAFCDTTYEGIMLDIEKWRANVELATPIIQKAKDTMDAWLLDPTFNQKAIELEYISNEDRVMMNLKTQHQKRGEMLQRLFPDIPGGNLPMVNRYLKDNMDKLNETELNILWGCSQRSYVDLHKEIVTNHRSWAVSYGYLVPAGMATINWNSGDQVMPLARIVEPKIQGLSEEEINETTHKIFRDLQDYRSALKLHSTYGEKYIHDHVYPDGKVHTNFNQIISTGRCSSSKPNMQQLPVGDKVTIDVDKNGLRYRNAFICEEGWSFVDSDYSSQELTIIAYISKDPVWMDAIENGYDLHSVCADLVYKKKWKAAAQDDCAYYKMVVGPDGQLRQAKQKCKCRGHKSLRDSIKPINFGLAYGMTKFKLAGTLQITVKQAQDLIDEYFSTFPAIGRVLDFLGDFGIKNGWVPTMGPFYRRRYYPNHRLYSEHEIAAHLAGVVNIPELARIGRQSKNHPIQGTSADIVKVAMWIVRDYIRENNLRDIVKFQMQVHDQITTKCVNSFVDEWKPILDRLMRDAAKLVIPTGILVADTQSSPVWTK
jgi:DNA polymerase I-like protein with 3'-5' exonuclease and polymerase domains